MAFPQTLLDIAVELYLGGQWVDITSDVLGDKNTVSISMGRDDGTSNLQPSSMSCILKNAIKYAPLNPTSPYYGLIGLNTPIRVSVKPHLTGVLAHDVSDLFTRTETSYWGTSTSGDTYAITERAVRYPPPMDSGWHTWYSLDSRSQRVSRVGPK
jgi:hypothetical protein